MKVLVIGGIAAGASVAAKAQRSNPDAQVTIIEKEDYVSFGACGLPYYVGGQFDNADRMYARTIEETERKGVRVLNKHEVLAVDFDKKTVLVKDLDGKNEFEESYDKLAICTGATPHKFGDGSDASNVYTMTKERDANQLLKDLKDVNHVAVVGSGFLGTEFAEQLAHLGKKVTIIHRGERIVDNIFDQEISEILTREAMDKGINFMNNSSYESFEVKNGKAVAIITDKGRLECDAAILAIGFKPNTGFIVDERLKKLRNGAILIDRAGKTSIEDVYAAGDCASVYHEIEGQEFYAALATYANKMGKLVGENIVSKDQKEYLGALGSSSIKVGDFGAAFTGLSEHRAKKLGLDVKTTFITDKNQTSYLPGQEEIYIKLVYDAKTRVILGGQIAGKKGAVERIGGLVVAVHTKLTVDELGYIDFPYSPPFSPTWDPLNVAGNVSK